jgi:hypothetical protein
MCSRPIPVWLQRKPSDPSEAPGVVLDGWAFAVTLEALRRVS